MLRVSVAALLLSTACASFRGAAEVEGPMLTIANESFAQLDLSYRCTENGPVQRLGAVNPQRTATFVVRPAFCRTVYLIRQPIGIQPLGLDKGGEQPIAVIQLGEGDSADLIFTAAGVLMNRAAAVKPDSTDAY